jgi:hypothetical protein
LFGYVLRDPMYSYYLCVGVAALIYCLFARIEGTRFGRAINAVRQDADAAAASGLRITLLKSQCFVIAAFVAGLAGSLYAHEVRYLAPTFHFLKSIEILIMVVTAATALPGRCLVRQLGGLARFPRIATPNAGLRHDPDRDHAVRGGRARRYAASARHPAMVLQFAPKPARGDGSTR